MSVADSIINGTYGKSGNKGSVANSIINGTFTKKKKKDEEDEDIITVSSKSKSEEKDTNTWFKKSEAYDDDKGNWLTDTAATIGSSVADVGVNVGKGLSRLSEGVANTIVYGVADVQEWRGNKEEAERLRENTKISLTDEMFKPAEAAVDKNSVFGDKSDSIAEGLGYVAGMTAVGYFTGGIGTTATTFVSSYGNGVAEALNDGATNDEARIYGAISGAGEALSELMFGGLGKASGAVGLSKGIGEFDDMLASGLTKNIKNKMVKTIVQSGIKATGEGLEEVVSGLISSVGKKVSYMSDRKWSDIRKDENLLEQFWMGALTSAIAQAPSTMGSIRNGTDYITGKTQNEQKVYDNEVKTRTDNKLRQATIEQAYNNEIKAKENLGIEITDEVKAETMQKVEKAYDNGKLKSIELNKKELGKIEKQVQTDMEEGNISLENIRNAIGENQDISKDNLLMRSMYENEQKSVSYQFEATDNEKVNNLMQSAVDAGMNNTTKTRRKIELISKLTKDSNYQYKFVSPEQIKEMGYNENANGLINKDNGEILINSTSNKGIMAIIGHETTHIFDGKVKGEYTKEYQTLQDTAIDYAITKGIYQDKMKSIMKAYDYNVIENDSQIKEELTADLVGDFLFNDESFIENLAVKDRNVFQKIYDYIKHTYKMMKGTDEEKAFEELKNKFEKVYKTLDNKTTETNTDTKYSFLSEKMLSGNKEAMDMLKAAKELKDNHENNGYIRQLTGWFPGNDGKWKAEVDDSKSKLIKKLEKNKTYKLGDILQHDKLYNLQPAYKNIEVNTGNISGNGKYSRNTGAITLSNNIINNVEQVRSTLLHEIQHATQHAEGWQGGTNLKAAGSWEAYQNNYGEKEAREVQARRNMTSDERMLKTPINQTNIQYSLTQDNQGKTLSKEQQEYFKDSKVRDENGNLLTVYHGSKTKFTEFNSEVNWFTPSKEYSNNYGKEQNKVQKALGIEAKNSKNTYETYLDIKNPKVLSNIDGYINQEADVKEFLKLSDISEEDFNNVLAEYNKGKADNEQAYRIYNLVNSKEFKSYLQSKGYDGIKANEKGNVSYAVFDSNQVKNTNNTKPTNSNDIRYSLTDNKGKKLTEYTVDKTKDSKVRDENGNLMLMYHGSPNGTYEQLRAGSYFTSNKEYAERYKSTSASSISSGKTENNPRIYEAYLNIEKPFDLSNEDARRIYIDEYIKGGNAIGINPYLSDAEYNNIKDIDWTEVEDLKDFLQENGYDYDGIVADEGADGGYGDDVKYRGKSYIPFSEEQIIKANENNTKYSLSEEGKLVDNTTNKEVKLEASETGTNGTLMAIHNLTEDKMKGILELGGFPVPSIAITDPIKNNHTQFGNISVIFDKSTIDPANYQNEVYDRDVWSPTFPSVEYNINDADIKKHITNKLDYDTKDDIVHDAVLNYMYATNLSNKVDRYGINDTLNEIKKDASMKYLYKTSVEKDSNYNPDMKNKQYSSSYENETLKRFIDNFTKTHDMSLQDFFYHYINYKDMTLSESEKTQLNNQIVEALRPEYEKFWSKYKDSLTERQIEGGIQTDIDNAINNYGKWYNFLMNASSYEKNGETQMIDKDSTLKNIDKYIDNNKYEQWVDSTFGELFRNTEKGIRNNKDPYTNSGNRRPFKQLHDDYNLSNVVRALTSKDTKGGEGGMTSGSFGEIQAKMANRFNSIEDIKNASEKLTSGKEANELLEPLRGKIQDSIKELSEYYHSGSYYSNSYEMAAEAVSEFAGKSKQTVANFKKVLKGFYNFDVDSIPNSVYNSIIENLNSLKNIQTDYFEAKPQRAVGLDEIQAITIANTVDSAFKQELIDRGFNVVEYDPNIEGDRQNKINQFQDLKFSMTNDTPITGDDIAVRDMLKQPTIEDEVGNTTTPTVEDVITQTPEEKAQGMKDKAKKYLSRSKTKFINKIVEDFGTSKIANTKTLNDVVDRIRTDIQENGPLTKEKSDNYFNELYNNLVTIDTLYYDTYKDVKDMIRQTKLYISDEIKGDIADYNEFRKRNMGTLLMTSDSNNLGVDEYYQELNELYPELFPEDIINPTDQLEKISEVAKDISKVEMNVAAYNDKYMAEDYKSWARAEFDKDINDFMQDIKLADRYNTATNEKEVYGADKETIKLIYQQLPDAKKIYEKAMAKELLTKEDNVQVDRLLNNEITAQEIPDGLNKKGIMNVAQAKIEYYTLQKVIKEYQDTIRNNRLEQAEKDVGDLNQWKDKKTGFRYSRETAIRNIYDIAPKDVADNIVNKYFRSYIETNEKKVVDAIKGYNERISDLDIGTKNKYKITYDNETKKVSESALIQLLGEKKITAEDVKNSGADVTKIENTVKEFRNIYNELIEQINESMLDNGYAPMEYRKDYFPHFTEETTDTLLGKAAKLLGIDITNREELPTDIAGQTYKFKPGRTWFSNMLQRTTDVTDYDVLKGFDKYVRGATDLIYHTGDIQNLRALSTVIRGTYNDTEIQNRVEEIKESTMSDLDKSIAIQDIYDKAKDKTHLSKFVEWLDNYTNLVAGKKAINDRGAEKELNRQVYKTMQDVESRIAANAIGGNVGVSLTNFAPIAQAWGEVKTHNLINGIWQTMKSSIKGDTSFADESQFITRRRGTDTLVESTLEKVTKPINTVLEFADNFTSEALVRARYNQNLQEGMSNELALQEADRYVAGLMADRGRGALPTQFSNKNPISKMINMFQVEVNNQWSYYMKDLPKHIQEKANGNKTKIVSDTAIAYTKVMVGSCLVNELLGAIRGNSTRVLPDPIYIIKELIKGLTDDDKDNDDDAVISTLTEIAGNVPFVSLPATLFADSLGLDVGDIGRISISGAIPNIADITSDLLDKDMTAGEKVKSVGGELLDTVGASLLLPYGGSQLKKTVKGLGMYANDIPGNYTDKGDLRYTVEDDVGSKVQAALFGAYANPYAQDYVESGYKSIKKENIDEMVGLDMNSTEYRQYKKGLSNSSKTEDKLNYINSLDLTDAQKTLAANNINKNSNATIDMSEYGNYGSYDEYKYARDYPGKYSTISQITDYDSYNQYKSDIEDIKEQYDTSKERKAAVQSYINSLDLNMYQKMMLEKMAGGYSIKNYKNYMKEYLDSTNLTQQEKYTIWEELFN